MGKSLTYKIIEKNRISESIEQKGDLTVKVNQTLTQDSTGTMVYLQLDAMGIQEIKTDLSVAYIDHNTLQTGFENADDHEFIKSAAAKYGIIYSKPGNGICHQLHLERFGKPGDILLGSDSHTPTGGGLGMLAIGAGGLDVAVAMAQGIYTLKVPKVMNIELVGKLQPWVSAKDAALHVLKLLTVKGGVGYIIEYSGEGIRNLSVTDRATIANMGAETGATTSIFPSDEVVRDFLVRQGREKDYTPFEADDDAEYDKKLIIDLGEIWPMAAKPHSPDNADAVRNIKGVKVDQVAIGSCTNSSYTDMMKTAAILKGKRIHPDVSLVIAPGSSNILKMMADNGTLGDLLASGARIIEAACGPCIGMGQAPRSGGISLRTFNRNFKGRCGTDTAEVYLVSPETAAVSALTGYLTSPDEAGLKNPVVELPQSFAVHDSYFIFPAEKKEDVELVMGPNIKPFPVGKPLPQKLECKLLLKVGDNITTDDIMPSNARLLPYRSNIPELSKYCFGTITKDFRDRARENGGGFILGGENYGQGSSREHAALVPLYLGVKAIIAKSFARIHRDNLINSGILPLVLTDKNQYNLFDEFDEIEIDNTAEAIKSGNTIKVLNKTKGLEVICRFEGSEAEAEILRAGGYLNHIRAMRKGAAGNA